MKRLNKILVVMLLAGLFGIVAVGSLSAATTVGADYDGRIKFNSNDGIRWNPGLSTFEVFDTAGISHIASGRIVDVKGVSYNPGTENIPFSAEANSGAKYTIMNDISFDAEGLYVLDAFKEGGINLSKSGEVDGKGFDLTGFPLRAGSTLFYTNEGTIKNINLVDVVADEESVDVTHTNSGLLVYENNGTVENCTVSGSNMIKYTENIGGISYQGTGVIKNSTNKQSISTTKDTIGGITAISNGMTINSCDNSGKLQINSSAATVYAGGIVAYISARTTIILCENSGSVTASAEMDNTIAYTGGIAGYSVQTLDGEVADPSRILNCTNTASVQVIAFTDYFVGGIISQMNNLALDNTQNGSVSGSANQIAGSGGYVTVAYALNKGGIKGLISRYGISWNVIETAFDVYSTAGFSYIASNYYIPVSGKPSIDLPSGVESVRATPKIRYLITSDINYELDGNELPGFGTIDLKSIEEGGEVDGQNNTLTNFPIVGSTNDTSATLFASNEGTLTRIKVHNPVYTGSGNTPNTGILVNINTGTISYCETSGDIVDAIGSEVPATTISRSGLQFGGMVCFNSGTIQNFASGLNVFLSNAGYYGGVAGQAVNGTFTSGVVTGTFQSFGGLTGGGGVVGRSESCVFQDLVMEGSYYGGEAGVNVVYYGGIGGLCIGDTFDTISVMGGMYVWGSCQYEVGYGGVAARIEGGISLSFVRVSSNYYISSNVGNLTFGGFFGIGAWSGNVAGEGGNVFSGSLYSMANLFGGAVGGFVGFLEAVTGLTLQADVFEISADAFIFYTGGGGIGAVIGCGFNSGIRIVDFVIPSGFRIIVDNVGVSINAGGIMGYQDALAFSIEYCEFYGEIIVSGRASNNLRKLGGFVSKAKSIHMLNYNTSAPGAVVGAEVFAYSDGSCGEVYKCTFGGSLYMGTENRTPPDVVQAVADVKAYMDALEVIDND